MRKTGAQILWESLKEQGVDLVFGYPGGAILPAYDEMTRHPEIRHVLARHEQGATHMADGYARASGKLGVVIATSGPGATNLVTGLGTAMMDSSPILCLTGQVPTTAMGGDAFQETDTVGVSQSVTKHNYLVTDVDDLAEVIAEACEVALSGRPGPVLVDIPKDVQLAMSDRGPRAHAVRLPGRESTPAADVDLQKALDLITASERPVILAGHGVSLSGAEDELRRFAERADIPVALTLLGKGAFPEAHPLCLGMMGMHGDASVNQAIQSADLLLAFGMRFDDRVTGKLTTYAPLSRKIHVDIDAAEIGKNVPVDVGLVGDLKPILARMLEALPTKRHAEWWSSIQQWRQEVSTRDIVRRPAPRGDGSESAAGGERLMAAHVIDALHRHTGGEVINVTDVGQHQMWEAQYFPHQRPGTLFTSGGMGTMGFAVPAAIGVKLARPEEEVWAIVGDGGFQMTMCELATAVQENVPIHIAIINNGYLGMVRQWQEFFYEKRYHATPMLAPDFCALAQAFGIPATRVHRHDQLAEAIAGRGQDGQEWQGPTLVEFVVEAHDAVFPMVPAGADLDAMIRRPKPSAERSASYEASSGAHRGAAPAT